MAGPEPELTAIAEAVSADGLAGPHLQLVERDACGDTLAGIATAAPYLADAPFVLQFGDALLQDDLGDIVGQGLADGVDGLVAVQDRNLSGREALDFDGARLVNLLTEPGRFSRVTPAGFYLLSGNMAQLAQDLAGNAETLPSAVELLLERGGRVKGLHVKGAWRYGGDPRQLLEGNRYLLERLSAPSTSRDLDNVEVQGRVLVDPSADVSDSTIRGPAVVGARARICDAYIGPYTSIGPDVTVEGAEIEHSIVLPGATISHIGRRLETSIVGTGAKLFRDFRLPNALRVQVGDGAEIALA